MNQLLIATNNTGKVKELHELLRDSGIELVTPAAIGLNLEVTEDGQSYAENAAKKAAAFARASGLISLADDSGLEVDALDGEPGPLHHVNGWDGCNQEERIQILLDALSGTPPERRTGRFRGILYVLLPDGHSLLAEGVCEGVITDRPAGVAGFGYDPVLLIPGLGKTMAELTLAEKNGISHRAVARDLGRKLKALLDSKSSA